jgi:phosphatidylserine/phosphatidylglycerophosphate/cardiolipin synthase-like enzyme
MAKFLNTRKAVSEIEDLIRTAGEKLILVSPYLKISKDFKELLSYRNSKDKITTVLFGKQELNPDEMKFLQGLRFVILKYNEDLHAKCYMNDDKMIITSLNLYQFSMANNKEMGVLIDKNDPSDAQLFAEASEEVEYISQNSQRFEFGQSKSVASSEGKEKNKTTKSQKGFCIRTGVEIPFNMEKPFSPKAFESWNKYRDEEYPEKYCHYSSEPSNGETSFIKPVLRKNWNKVKELG